MKTNRDLLRSSQYKMYAEAELQDDLYAMYQKTKHKRVNYIVGHSYGCSQTVKLVNSLSAAEKKALKGIILIGGTLPGRDGGHPVMKLPSFMLSFIQPWLSKMFRENAYHTDCDPELLAEAEARSNSNPMFMCKYFYEQTKWCTVEEVSQVDVKALVIHGEEDKILPISGARSLASALRTPLKVIQGTSHQCMEEKPEEVAKEIIAFMSS
jgi:pimeloyl-ACP methyl ester carboxylesterase